MGITLKAKSGRDGATVAGHTRDVVDAAATLFGSVEMPTPLGRAWARLFRLDDAQLVPFLRHLLASAYCHDLGKASDSFQRLMHQNKPQSFRHEQLSLLVLRQPAVRAWLTDGGLDAGLIEAAVAGHHLKLDTGGKTLFEEMDSGRGGGQVRLFWQDTQVQDVMREMAKALGLGEVPTTLVEQWSFGGVENDLFTEKDDTGDELEDLNCELEGDAQRKRLASAVRSALIAADSAGSGLVRNGLPIVQWLQQAFADPLTAELVGEKVIDARLAQAGLTREALNAFQRACGDGEQVPARALLLAPCGSGKTLAAWNWIAARCAERPRGAAIFLYPTRGTATEGYNDYAGLAGVDVAQLVHGTADLDLDGMEDVTDNDRLAEQRLFALRQWPKRIFSATVDQFLGFVQHQYGPTCHLPLLADAAVVIDEVHAFDRGMFSALVTFLREMDVPVLCMTATLSPRRQKDLETVGLRCVNGLALDGEESELTRAANHGRYEVRTVENAEAAETEVRLALAAGQRVLWVVNTVQRCQSIVRRFVDDVTAPELETVEGLPVFCYHSRFKLDDRKQWHERVVAAFKGERANAVLAVTTQVCEMSLDLDADVLVTELCPASALVQRMGRCCRDRHAHRSGRVGKVRVYWPTNENGRSAPLPYTADELSAAEGMLRQMTDEPAVSQQALEDWLDKIDSGPEMLKACRFFSSAVWASAGEELFRDASDLSRQAVLDRDIDAYHQRRTGPTPWKADGLVMQVPKQHTQPHDGWTLPKWLHVVKSGVYYESLGHCDDVGPTHLFG